MNGAEAVGAEAVGAAALTAGSVRQVRKLREARKRNPDEDLPRSVLVCKWSLGDSWTVLEANLQTKDFRILYVDPFDGNQKVWNVSRTYEAYLEQARRGVDISELR
jgi:hypothetical protein